MTAKKRLFHQALGIMLAIFLFVMFAFMACSEGAGGKKDEYIITFDYNYEGAPAAITQKVEKGDVAEEPAKPTREHYNFTNWYKEAACKNRADFEEEILTNATYYAGWEQTEGVVSFYMNDGTDSLFMTSVVAVNGTVAEPSSVPERSGYLFDAWYQDAACSKLFDFSTMLTSDLAAYANWIKDDGNSRTVTYYWNYENAEDDGVYRTQKVAYGDKLTLPSPDRGSNYKFMGWYTDAACSMDAYYDGSKKVRENIALYALWYNSVTFEAEYTDVSQISGYGYSGQLSGTKIINKDLNNKANASNGWYVSYLYYKGITLTFNIYAEEEVTDALLYMRLSAEYYDLTLTDEQFLVQVNDEQMKYGSISIPINNAGSSGGVTSSSIEVPFQDFLVTTKLHLKQGNNVISLIVNNFKPESERTGTMYSYAPVVDAIKICSSGDVFNIKWAEGYPLESNLETANNTYG